MTASNSRAEAAARSEASVTPLPTAAPPPPEPAAPKKARRRFALIAALPIALAAVGGFFWLTSGRYVSTDDAYVQQDRVTIVPEVAGRIVAVGAAENQRVKAGDVLFQIDDSTYQVIAQKGRAAVASARLDVERLKAVYAKSLSDQIAAAQTLTYAQDTFKRQDKLAGSGVVAASTLDRARLDVQQSEANLSAAEQAVLSAKAALAGDPDIQTDNHPEVLQALANLDQAELDLARTRVVSPAAGIVSQTDRLQVGQYVMPGAAVLSLVETEDSWIEANFKETELTHLTEGQPVTVKIDTYPGAPLKGRVESLGAGTGAEFSLLPAQNATGNWVKVVQRIPVRISLAETQGSPALRTGMSAHVSVDTGRGGLAAFGADDPALRP